MEKIASFTVDHIHLLPGVYVSRKDKVGEETVTSFDLRFTRPNIEPAMENAPMHAIEHLAATFLRNDAEWKERILYFGPMGCRTGFYLLLKGDLESQDIQELLLSCFSFIAGFEGEIPGATEHDCGNFRDMNLPVAKWWSKKYCQDVLQQLSYENTHYPA